MTKHREINADDLLAKLGKVHPRNGTCQLTMQNNVPSDVGAVIVAAGCKFVYSDGTEYTDGPVGMSIGSGNSYTFISDKPGGCVQGTLLAATVEVNGQNPQNFTASETADPSECLLHVTEVLGQQNVVAKGSPLVRKLHFAKR